MKNAMLFLFAIAMAWLTTGHQSPALAQENQPSAGQTLVRDFDRDVAAMRREMKQFCAYAQQLAAPGANDETKRQAASKHLGDALDRWNSVVETYRNNPPAEYATDGQFKQRLEDVKVFLQDMNRHFAAGDMRHSFMTCGYICGLFVAMHEENGLNYALDRLFHLRKSVKTIMAVEKKIGATATVQQFGADLTRQQSMVVQAPNPFPSDDPRREKFQTSVQSISAILARMTTQSGSQESPSITADLMKAINTSYDMALEI